ncbi:hypothetical protein D3C80_1961730 [compost metagenome]
MGGRWAGASALCAAFQWVSLGRLGNEPSAAGKNSFTRWSGAKVVICATSGPVNTRRVNDGLRLMRRASTRSNTR